MRELLRKAKPRAARRPDRAQRALPARARSRAGWSTTSSRASRARPRSSTSCRSSSRSSSDTYGVIAYQEQVMRIARGAGRLHAGRSPTCCARRWARRTPKVMAKQREAFIDGAQGQRRQREEGRRKIFDLMEYFAGYGFNKSHSTTYALLAYQTAYLKANYPWHFAAALLTIEAQNTDKLALYLGECRDRGIPVCRRTSTRASCASRSTPEGVRFGLRPSRTSARARSCRCSTSASEPGRIDSLHALCEDARSAARQQARAREPGQGGRARLAGSAPGVRPPLARGAPALRRRRRRHRARQPHRSATRSSGRPSCSAAATTAAAEPDHPAAGRAALDRDRAARLREGSARPLSERPSARSLRRRPARRSARARSAT